MIFIQKTIIPKEEFTDITDEIQQEIEKIYVLEGICTIYSKHTTACIRILENEELLKKDMHNFFERLAPSSCLYLHDDLEHRSVAPEERRNGYSHLRAMLLNHHETVPIINGKLDLGKWQRIFYLECDWGKKDRTYNLAIQ